MKIIKESSKFVNTILPSDGGNVINWFPFGLLSKRSGLVKELLGSSPDIFIRGTPLYFEDDNVSVKNFNIDYTGCFFKIGNVNFDLFCDKSFVSVLYDKGSFIISIFDKKSGLIVDLNNRADEEDYNKLFE